MNKNKSRIIIDETLTPENANNRHLAWLRDAIYDPEAPEPANKDFIEMQKNGHIFGRSASQNLEQNKGIGIYKYFVSIKPLLPK